MKRVYRAACGQAVSFPPTGRPVMRGRACGARRLDEAPLAPVLQAMYPGARVHHGFLQSFQTVTNADDPSTNLKCALRYLFSRALCRVMPPKA